MTSQVGTLLDGRYRLDARIGAGGMSTVYRAFDTVLERQVAIKLMHREIASQSDQLERFRREARAVAQLNHPHVVGVIDAGEDDGMPYIVFEHVEGETLKDRIRRHDAGLPVPEAVAYAIEVARGLGAAHERGIVHRDVKPQNVLVDGEGLAKVTDFGIARTLDQQGLTADGRVLGTTDYVSPEQALGHAVTGQSDLYSLGIVLYEMLTGEVPFRGDNQVAVAMKHVREDLPDVQVRRPGISSALGAAVDRATAKDLDRRFQTADEMVSELEDVLTVEAARAGGTSGQATAVIRSLPEVKRSRIPAAVRHPRRIFAVLAAVAVAAVVLLVVARHRTTRGTGAPVRTPAVAKGAPGVTGVSLGQDAGHAYDPIGGDGEHDAEAKAVTDNNANTSWSTESYETGALQKAGVGIYVDAKPGTAARKIDIQTSTPGFSGEVYASNDADPTASPDKGGWGQSLATIRPDAGRQIDLTLDTGATKYRYYLVWITRLPAGKTSVKLSEIALFQDR